MTEQSDSDSDDLSAEAWIARFATALGLDAPDAATIETLLNLAGVAAHDSQRVAAPIACYLVGRAGLDPVVALEQSRTVAG